MRAVYEAVADPRYRRVIAVMGAQMAKTELLLNLIGHKLDDDPGPVIFVGASQRQVESISTSRVAPMLRTTSSLAAKLDTRRTVDRVTEKIVAGQRLGFAWAGSAIELSSHPAALVLIDERDRMESDVAGEGDPLALAEARVATYPNGKVVVTSTPTLEGGSPIWRLWESGTGGKWSWPCPECEAYFVPAFELLRWPEHSTSQRAKREARLACPQCGAMIDDKHKPAMNAAGRYELSGDPESDTASFWVSGLASPWRSWGLAAQRWLEAHRSGEQEEQQAVINTVFGELFKIAGDAPPAALVQALRAGYQSDEVPTEVQVLTAGVDLQVDRLVYVVRGWGPGSSSWLIRHGEIWGDTAQPEVWQRLAELLEHAFADEPAAAEAAAPSAAAPAAASPAAARQPPAADPRAAATVKRMRVRMMLIDSGYRPDVVYAFARRFPGRAYPSKGHDTLGKPAYIARLGVTADGRTHRRDVNLVHIDSGYFKGWVHGRISWPADQPGAWHLPVDATDDYCAQVISEQRVVKPNGQVRWIKTAKANHFLDAEALASAAAHLLNVHLLKTATPKGSGANKPTTSARPLRRDPLAPFPKSGWITNY